MNSVNNTGFQSSAPRDRNGQLVPMRSGWPSRREVLLTDGVLVTGDDGIAAFTGLQIDNQTVTIRYRLTEIATRDGSTLMTTVLYDGSLPDVNGDTEITDVKITAVNNRNFELPNSGGNGFPMAAVGVALMFISLLFAVCFIRRSRKAQ